MAESLYETLSRLEPPADPGGPPYRGWTIWYDAGLHSTGITYRETKWRARGPSGELIAHPDPGSTGDLAWVKAEIDRRMAA